MIDMTPVLFFVNGLGAMALSRRKDFAGHEMPPSLRLLLGTFGAVFFLLGYFLAGRAKL